MAEGLEPSDVCVHFLEPQSENPIHQGVEALGQFCGSALIDLFLQHHVHVYEQVEHLHRHLLQGERATGGGDRVVYHLRPAAEELKRLGDSFQCERDGDRRTRRRCDRARPIGVHEIHQLLAGGKAHHAEVSRDQGAVADRNQMEVGSVAGRSNAHRLGDTGA